jgi:spermidine-citrate ligase
MMAPEKRIAEQVTAEAFLNCYLREVTEPQFLNTNQIEDAELGSRLASRGVTWVARAVLPQLCLELLAPVRYRSRTWRHRFDFPLYYRSLECGPLIPLDYVTLAALVAKELNGRGQGNCADCSYDELVGRMIDSCKNTERFLRERRDDLERLRAEPLAFIDAEQSVLLGHPMHPTPKSWQGMHEGELAFYAPEMRARFALHYFLADRSLVREDSALSHSASALIMEQLARDMPAAFRSEFCERADAALLPVHPWQAGTLLKQPQISALLQDGRLRYLGAAGQEYLSTMSVRTVYHPDAPFMYKLSLSVKITNSLRVNLEKELERGLEIYRVLGSEIGDALARSFPDFSIIGDPAYITLAVDSTVLSDFSTVLRENPFVTHPAAKATPVAALCQDDPFGKAGRLARLVTTIAERERCSVEDVCCGWFRRYVELLLQPVLWLYFTHGIGLEAHQQNTVVELESGYPARLFYRDNQGYYYRRTKHAHLSRIIPGISEKSHTVCDDAVVDERLLYYVFINNLFGLINAFGTAGLVTEDTLLADLRMQLDRIAGESGEPTPMLDTLLDSTTLRCKSNLMTRFHDMDELVGSVATQSVYVAVPNPLKEVSCAA